MTTEANALHVSVTQSHKNFIQLSIIIPAQFVDRIYHETSIKQKAQSHTFGFARGTAPLEYVKDAFNTHILEHVQQFLLNYIVINALYHEMIVRKITCAGEPRLTESKIEQGKDALFVFECSLPESLSLRGWKYYPFKSPKRKNYRDLDRQVKLFIQKEEEQTIENNEVISIGDWVCFELCVTDTKQCPLLENQPQTMWLKIGVEETDKPLQSLFCGKQIGDSFHTLDDCIQEQFCTKLDTRYVFNVVIKDVIYDKQFNLGDFKSYFRLRTNKEIHKKMIEVFSYRNDISQRREMAEEAFKVMFMHHRFEVPKHVILRRQHELLQFMHDVPDYHVYKTQQNFEDTIKELAEKQVREAILIDQLSLKEKISIKHQDIKHYINLLKRPRTKEFIHFDPPITKLNGCETIISEVILKRHCLREKTLNHIIYHLSKR